MSKITLGQCLVKLTVAQQKELLYLLRWQCHAGVWQNGIRPSSAIAARALERLELATSTQREHAQTVYHLTLTGRQIAEGIAETLEPTFAERVSLGLICPVCQAMSRHQYHYPPTWPVVIVCPCGRSYAINNPAIGGKS